MRCCHIVPGFYPGYAAPFEYTRKLSNMGVDVDVIAMGRPGEPIRDVVNGVQIRRVSIVGKQRFSPTSSLGLISTTLSQLSQREYDLVHVYAFRGCGLLPTLGKRNGLHWILDIRTGNVGKNVIRSHLADTVTALESKAFHTHIALDEHVGRKVLGKNSDFYTVPLGADLQKFRPLPKTLIRESLNIAEDQCMVIYIGSLDPQRNPKRIFESFKIASRYHSKAVLVVIGRGATLTELRSFAHELNIETQVRILQYVPYTDIHEYVASADIGFAYVPDTPQFHLQPPLKTVEFLACGLPTVATNTKGNARFIQDRYNGLLVPDTSLDLGSALQELMQDDTLSNELTARARSSVLQYDWQSIVREKLLPIYQTLESSSMRKKSKLA